MHQVLYINLRNFPFLLQKNFNILNRIFLSEKRDANFCYERAKKWIIKNTIPGKGVISSSLHKNISHIEVTGYLIPTLISAKEIKLARQYAVFLKNVQRPNGAFTGSADGKEYVFDSGQALRGFLAASYLWPEFKPYAKKTADYIISLMKESGSIPSMYDGVTENINIYILPALREASKILEDEKYEIAAKKSLQYYKNKEDILNENLLTHDLAYILDGFCDMEGKDFVRQFIKDFFKRRINNGKILAYPNDSWTCSAGDAQLAVVAYKLGMQDYADEIMGYLCKVQNISGGFYGSYGFLGYYFNDAEIGWVNKFFMDAVHLKTSRA